MREIRACPNINCRVESYHAAVGHYSLLCCPGCLTLGTVSGNEED